MPSTPRRLRPVALTVAVFALFALGTSTALALRRTEPPLPPRGAGERPTRPSASARSAKPSPSPSFPEAGPGTWRYASTTGPVYGKAGPVRRYRVAVESNIPLDVSDFAATVDAVLGDTRGWTAGGRYRLQQVPGNAPAEFTVYLATRQTSTTMCLAGGLHTDGYTSCRTPGRVILNLDRWLDSVPHYGAPLDVYREYLINHETGHQLGHGHELCPGAGSPAPVMEQQTLGLHGCTANPWPYLGGERYVGPAGEY